MDAPVKMADMTRHQVVEKEFRENTSNQDYRFHLFKRVSAVDLEFNNIDFSFVVFDDCYFRNCKFFDCTFTGAQFKSSSFRGSAFRGSTFDYARFNNSKITPDLINQNIPGWENVALEFAQSLRVNFAQIGDVEGVNRAIKAELTATKAHLRKAAWSGETHYRQKYRGPTRLYYVWKSGVFSVLDFIWGNGESLLKLARTIAIVILICSFTFLINGLTLENAIFEGVSSFLGTSSYDESPQYLTELMAASRYILLGLFVSVLVKRLSRR